MMMIFDDTPFYKTYDGEGPLQIGNFAGNDHIEMLLDVMNAHDHQPVCIEEVQIMKLASYIKP